MIYVFVDTNLWVRLWSQGKPGCEIEHFNVLRQLTRESKVVFLLPEIVELEVAKIWRTFRDEITRHMSKLLGDKLDGFIKQQVWSEIEDVQGSLSPLLDKFIAGARDAKIKCNRSPHLRN